MENIALYAPEGYRAMESNQQDILLTNIIRPKIALRPVRRNSPEYIELVASIRKAGVYQPILVRPVEDGYEIVEGWHRYEASKEAGRTSIPCIVREMTDHEVLIAQLQCQSIRPRTAPFEYARRLKLLMQGGLTLKQLSEMISKTPGWIQSQIQLNRLCEAARAPVENGDIKMTAALALANLPADLQEKFIDDAISMPAQEFTERAKEALRDFKAYLLRLQQEDRETGAAKPSLRAINVLKREALKPKYSKPVLKAMKAKTAADGWMACLAWMFKLDPISVERRKTNYKEKCETQDRTMNMAEYRRTNREMIDKFVNHESLSGDYRNG
jgi:ParB/RepB/Spo0J family partition protein